jgi:hypothetical protein
MQLGYANGAALKAAGVPYQARYPVLVLIVVNLGAKVLNGKHFAEFVGPDRLKIAGLLRRSAEDSTTRSPFQVARSS